MKTILESINDISRILPKQTVNKTKEYRKSDYMIITEVDDGLLLYNTLTDEMILLEKDDIKFFNQPNSESEISNYLIEHYFLVPLDFSESKLAVQLKNILECINMNTKNVLLNNFVILTTTACNARCFYCFEKGAKVLTMTEKTAYDLVDFIKKKSAKKINLRWFGGEPLINTKVIDIITDELKKTDIKFESSIISNGYLFNEDLVKKAVSDWKLKDAQVTLDGTEEVYNRIKNYVYKNSESPFKRVLNNIELLLNNNVFVKIRLNLDMHNADDLFELAQMLTARFKKYSNCYIYAVQLFEDTNDDTKNRSGDLRKLITKKTVELQEYLNNEMVNIGHNDTLKDIKRKNPVSKCMASSDSSTIVMPDGNLGKCEHYVNGDFYGSIYSDKIDYDVIKKFKVTTSNKKECENCRFYLSCLHLECCSDSHFCNEYDLIQREQKVIQSMKNIYKIFKKQ